MLGKLIKHEFKSTWMVMTLILAILAGSGLFFGLSLRYFISQAGKDNLNDIQYLILGFTVFTFILIVVGLFILSIVYLIVHYYRSLYTQQGYLSFTLPATITEVVSSRMIVGCIWSMGIAAAFIVCLVLTLLTSVGDLIAKNYIDIVDSLDYIAETFGLNNFASFSFVYLIIFLLSVISSMLMLMFCISVGQLWQKHKIIGAILCYFATRFVLGLISMILQLGTGIMYTAFENTSEIDNMLSAGLIRTGVYSVVCILVFYFVSIYISNKQLNLD